MKKKCVVWIALAFAAAGSQGAVSTTCPTPNGTSLCSCADLPGEIDGPNGGASCGFQTCLPSGYCFQSPTEGCNYSNCVYGCSSDCDCPFASLTCDGSGRCVSGTNRGCAAPGNCNQDCAAAGFQGYEFYGVTPGLCMVHHLTNFYPDGYCPSNSVMPLATHHAEFDHDCPAYPRIGASWCCCNGPTGGCTSDAQCAGGQICLGRICQPCTSDTQCPGGLSCRSGACAAGPPTGQVSASAPSCTAAMAGTCTVMITWNASNTGATPVNVWVNGVSFGGCQAHGANVPATIHPGVTYSFTLMTGPNACINPLDGTPLAHVEVTGIAAAAGSCAAQTICGKVTAAENAIPLGGITLQLRDALGGVRQVTKTAADGTYVFPGLTQPAYYVTPVVGRMQSASPSQASVSISNAANFVVRGVPAWLRFDQLPSGTILLVTPDAPYAAGVMPSVGPGSAAHASYYAATAGPDGTAVIAVSPGKPYYYECWKPSAGGTFARSLPNSIDSATPLAPNASLGGLRCL